MTMQSWKEHYWHGVPCIKKRIETIIEAVNPEGKTIIEVGCNEGFLSKALQENGGSVTPVDYNQTLVDKANEIFSIGAVKGDINNLEYEDDSFDVAVGSEILEHIADPFKGLQELFRVAKTQVVISIPIGRYWMGELTHQWELGGSFIHHDSAQQYKAVKDLLILSWTKKRDENFTDIPPFNTAELKKEFGIT